MCWLSWGGFRSWNKDDTESDQVSENSLRRKVKHSQLGPDDYFKNLFLVKRLHVLYYFIFICNLMYFFFFRLEIWYVEYINFRLRILNCWYYADLQMFSFMNSELNLANVTIVVRHQSVKTCATDAWAVSASKRKANRDTRRKCESCLSWLDLVLPPRVKESVRWTTSKHNGGAQLLWPLTLACSRDTGRAGGGGAWDALTHKEKGWASKFTRAKKACRDKDGNLSC